MAAILPEALTTDKKHDHLRDAITTAVVVAHDEQLVEIKRELRLIDSLTNDSHSDFSTHDSIGRAVVRALRALNEFERIRLREAVAVNLLIQELSA